MRKRLASLVIVGTLMLAGAASVHAAPADHTRTADCVSPGGVDLNAYLRLSAAVVAPWCPRIEAGDLWVPAEFYFAAKTWEQMPDGYVPAGPTPLQDFVAKFVAIRYVVDEGRPNEFTVEFADGPKLWTGVHALNPDVAMATPMTLGSVRPLSIGPHTVRTFWIMSAMQCDGWSSVVAESCFPGAGPYDNGSYSFEVVR